MLRLLCFYVLTRIYEGYVATEDQLLSSCAKRCRLKIKGHYTSRRARSWLASINCCWASRKSWEAISWWRFSSAALIWRWRSASWNEFSESRFSDSQCLWCCDLYVMTMIHGLIATLRFRPVTVITLSSPSSYQERKFKQFWEQNLQKQIIQKYTEWC